MACENVNDLIAFLAVARERSFTRAAAQLGVSQSALSHTVRGLEERLGAAPDPDHPQRRAYAGGRAPALNRGPRMEEIEAELEAISEFREKPAGTIRITAGYHATETLLWPKLAKFLPGYPEIRVETIVDESLVDIVDQRFDAGVRLGEQVAKDMIAVRIGPDVRFAVVGAESYFATRPAPTRPQDLVEHTCINLRLPTLGGLWPWEFEKEGHELNVRVDGQLVFNLIFQVVNAALDGFGLAYVPEDLALPHLATGRLRRVLQKWSPPWPGYHLYYPSRRQPSAAFTLVVDALRHGGG